MIEDDDQLDIDDIKIDIPEEKPKEQNMLAALNKEKLASKFMTFKVMKQMKTKSEKTNPKEEQQDEKVGSVDEIKRRYGFLSASSREQEQIKDKTRVDIMWSLCFQLISNGHMYVVFWMLTA